MSCNVLPIVDFLYPKRVDKTDLSFSHPMSYPKRFEFFSLSCNTLIMIAHFSFSKTKKIGKKKKKKQFIGPRDKGPIQMGSYWASLQVQ